MIGLLWLSLLSYPDKVVAPHAECQERWQSARDREQLMRQWMRENPADPKLEAARLWVGILDAERNKGYAGLVVHDRTARPEVRMRWFVVWLADGRWEP